MPTPQEQVREFHLAFGLPAPEGLQRKIDVDQASFRAKLIEEESDEAVDELRWFGVLEGPGGNVGRLAKELADLAYVVYGAAVTFGIDLDAVIAEVHRSNMTKLGEDGKPIYREDGKVLKGPSYEQADIEKALAQSTMRDAIAARLNAPSGGGLEAKWEIK